MEKKMSEAYKKYRELLEIWHNSSPSELEKKLSIDDWQCLLKHAGTAQAKIYCSQWIEKLQKMGRDHDEKIEWYDFDNIYIETGKLYDQEGNLIIPGHYTHPKNGTMKIYTRKKYLFLEITYKNNKKHGMTRCYFENTKHLAWEQNYTNDKLDGICKRYNKSGKLIHEDPFVKGVKKGIERTYSKSGRLLCEEEYDNNVKNGISRTYYQNGNVKQESTYKNGKKYGNTKRYDITGKPKKLTPKKSPQITEYSRTLYKSNDGLTITAEFTEDKRLDIVYYDLGGDYFESYEHHQVLTAEATKKLCKIFKCELPDLLRYVSEKIDWSRGSTEPFYDFCKKHNLKYETCTWTD